MVRAKGGTELPPNRPAAGTIRTGDHKRGCGPQIFTCTATLCDQMSFAQKDGWSILESGDNLRFGCEVSTAKWLAKHLHHTSGRAVIACLNDCGDDKGLKRRD
jgi:hypothetical protein